MRGDIVALLEYEAKRRPAIAEMIENIMDIDIDAVVVPLPWFRKALLEYREREKQKQYLDAMSVIEHDFSSMEKTPDRIGNVVSYGGPSTHIRNVAGLEQEISTQDYFFVVENGSWFASTFFPDFFPRGEIIEENVEYNRYLDLQQIDYAKRVGYYTETSPVRFY